MSTFLATRTIRAPKKTPIDDPDDQATEFAFTTLVPNRELQLGDQIGVGGMAVVHEAHQRSLDRIVAVKIPKNADIRSSDLLEEAVVTGGLEHPNIVPVHDIDFSSGQPRIIMKRVEGIEWEHLIDDPGDEVSDKLQWNLTVLTRVCDAMEFAHSRGVLHRDLKPQNVMIGQFGEVYLMDWGLAVALPGAKNTIMSKAMDEKKVSGTPAYMAPEMAWGDGAALCVQTDVYLLGGLLYRIVAGKPPRMPRSREEMLEQVIEEPAQFNDGWPLVEVMRRALQMAPEDRYCSVADFRQALLMWTEGRAGRQLLKKAQLAKVRLRSMLNTNTERFELYNQYGACKFAFQEAIHQSHAPTEAMHSLRKTQLLMAEYEIRSKDPRAATLLLNGVPNPPQPLLDQIATLNEEKAAKEEEFTRLKRDVDATADLPARLAVVVGMGVVWLGPPLIATAMGLTDYTKEMAISSLTSLGTVVILAVSFPFLVLSRVNRVYAAVVGLSPVLSTVFLIGAWLAEIPSVSASALKISMFCAMTSIAAILADYRLIPGAIGFAVATWCAAVYPAHADLFLGLANLFLVVVAVALWVPSFLLNTYRSSSST